MSGKTHKKTKKGEVDHGFVVSRVRSGNSLSQEPWLPTDAKALRVSDDELLSDINIELSISARQPDEWIRQSLTEEELACSHGDTLRQIRIWSIFVDRNALARMLLYCWHSCLGSEFSTIKDEISELQRVAESQGFIKPSDIKKKMGGRTPGSFDPDNQRYYERFKFLTRELPGMRPKDIALRVAAEEAQRQGVKYEEKRKLERKVVRFFQRQELVPKSQKDRSRASRK